MLPTQVYPFRAPAVSYVGLGAVQKAGEEARRLRATQAVVITDPGLVKAGVADEVKSILVKAGIPTEIYSEVETEPSIESVERCFEVVKAGGYDLLVGLGGGSSMDTAKGCSLLSANPGSIRDYFGVDKVQKKGLPTILIATTSGTAAELTPNAIFADKEKQLKAGVVSPLIMADVAIVDPLLTLSVPPYVTAFTGMDALTHAVESYTAIKATHHTDLYALESIRLIAANLRTAVANGSNVEARYYMALGSYLAGFSLTNAGAGAVHAMAYPLGSQYHVPHGVANAVLLPYVLEFNILGDLPKFARIAEAMGEDVIGLSPRAAAERAVEAIRQLSADIGIPQRLRDLGVKQESLAGFVPGTMSATRLIDNNPRRITADDVLAIFQKAW